jgi:hypothetical protein
MTDEVKKIEPDKAPESEPDKASKRPKLELVPPPADALDLAELWLDPALGDALVNVHFHVIPVGKPRDFFRVNPDPAYRRLCEIYTHKVEGQIEETNYIITKSMQGVIEEARRCTLVTCVYRDGSPRLWPLKLPRDGEKDNNAWISARGAAKTAMDVWIRLVWLRGTYFTRDADPKYAPEPDWSKLPPFDELVRLAFGEHGIIRDREHRIVHDLFGMAPKRQPDDDSDALS